MHPDERREAEMVIAERDRDNDNAEYGWLTEAEMFGVELGSDWP